MRENYGHSSHWLSLQLLEMLGMDCLLTHTCYKKEWEVILAIESPFKSPLAPQQVEGWEKEGQRGRVGMWIWEV